MRVPDYGRGDWDVKYEGNRNLPYISHIGLDGETIHMDLSEPADSIKVTGQDHTCLAIVRDTCRVEYMTSPDDSYARLTAWFPDGEVIYTNPFARYDSSMCESPFNDPTPDVSILMTLLFNLALILVCIGCTYTMYLILKKRK